MEFVAALIAGLEAQYDVVRPATSSDLLRPSRCPGWSVLDVLDHSIGVTVKFIGFATGATDRPRSPTGHVAGDGVASTLRSVVDRATSAWSTSDPTRRCHLPFGTFTAAETAGINLVDVLAHGWDVGVLGGSPFEVVPEVWAAGLEAAHTLIGAHRDPHHYGPAIDVGPTAPADAQFLAYLGRS